MLLLIISATVSPFLIQRWDMGSLTCANVFYVLLLINQTEWSMIPACPCFLCCFNRVNTDGTNSSKFVSDVCVCVFHVCEVIGFVD